MIIPAKSWMSAQMFQRLLSADATFSLSKFSLFSLEFPYKHNLVMSDSYSELNKYRIQKMTVIFKGLTQQIFEKFCYKCYMVGLNTSLAVVESAIFFDGLIWIKNHLTKSCQYIFSNLFFWVADMSGKISLIRFCAVQLYNHYLAAVWNVHVCFHLFVECKYLTDNIY